MIVQTFVGRLVSFGSAWVLFFLLYWHLPARRIPFRSSAVGATFSSVMYELMKGGFAWYVISLANYSNLSGGMGVVLILFFWIYYSAVVFILGGQVGRVHEVRRTERMRPVADATGGQRGVGAGVGGALLLAAIVCLPTSAEGQSVAPFGGNGNIPGFLNGSEGVVFRLQLPRAGAEPGSPPCQSRRSIRSRAYRGKPSAGNGRDRSRVVRTGRNGPRVPTRRQREVVDIHDPGGHVPGSSPREGPRVDRPGLVLHRAESSDSSCSRAGSGCRHLGHIRPVSGRRDCDPRHEPPRPPARSGSGRQKGVARVHPAYERGSAGALPPGRGGDSRPHLLTC